MEEVLFKVKKKKRGLLEFKNKIWQVPNKEPPPNKEILKQWISLSVVIKTMGYHYMNPLGQ